MISEETKKKMSLAHLGKKNHFYGKHHSEETKIKISKMNKGRLIGDKNPFYGKHHSIETKNRLSKLHLGKTNLKLRGRKFSKETKKKMSETRKKLFKEGILKSPTKGKHLSEETKIKISKANKGKLTGDNNPFRKLMQGPRREELIKMMSEVRKGRNLGKENPFYGKHHSEETRIKMKQNHWNKKLYFIHPRLNKKHSEETKMKISKANKGELSSNWLGGKSFEPYSPKFNKEFKTIIKLRDNFCCLNCGLSEQTHIILKRKRMTVHHIDYDKKNTCLQNCCTLCNYCNSKANFNREQWTEFFQEKLSNKYNYQYLNKECLIQNK